MSAQRRIRLSEAELSVVVNALHRVIAARMLADRELGWMIGVASLTSKLEGLLEKTPTEARADEG